MAGCEGIAAGFTSKPHSVFTPHVRPLSLPRIQRFSGTADQKADGFSAGIPGIIFCYG